ncbi:MAG: PEP/pyruvate-binding domain-containing protein [Mycobacterium sp.]|nr:PEP/pyruvate-binding domain-containing protein [Mycobacterium sp.]
MIVALSPDTDSTVERIGGKGAGLVRLLTAGLPVPEAWCIPADISLDADSRTTCLDEGLARWWQQVEAMFPGAPWAVRSSAVAEDLADASFAGVYETVLGVDSLDGLRQAVRTCWASYDDTRAQTYRDNLAKTNAVGIALILQRMIIPDAAGVLLTANPLRPLMPEIVIDAAWGLGETVVSGRTDPDNFVLDRASGALRSRTLGAKATEAVWDHGVHERDAEAARRNAFCLTTAQLHDLHELSNVVTERIGPRRDLEWAIADGLLFVLQDRPITNLPSDDPVDVWSTRVSATNTFPTAPCRSPEDLMVPWIIEMSMKEMAGLQGRRDMAAMAPVRLHHGYAYFSGAYFVEGMRMLPRSMRSNGADQWFPPLVLDRVRAATWDPRLLAGFALAPRRDHRRSGLKNNLRVLETHCTAIEANIVPKLDQDYGALSESQWRRQYGEVNALGEEHFRIVRWGMTIYNSFLHGLLQRLLETWCGDTSGELYQNVISGLDDTKTATINTEITGLARTALDDAKLTTMVRAGAAYERVRDHRPRTRGSGGALRRFPGTSRPPIRQPRYRSAPLAGTATPDPRTRSRAASAPQAPHARNRIRRGSVALPPKPTRWQDWGAVRLGLA